MSTVIVPRRRPQMQPAADLAREMRFQANLGIWHGQGETPYFRSCRRVHPPTGAQLIFTRDTGHHTSGWFKNPDYERCYHLSLSFWDLTAWPNVVSRFAERPEIEGWVPLFFPNQERFLWEESAYSEDGKRKGVVHFRVFCDPLWRPILPEGEVYTKIKTELGWLSWSDRVAAETAIAASIAERMDT